MVCLPIGAEKKTRNVISVPTQIIGPTLASRYPKKQEIKVAYEGVYGIHQLIEGKKSSWLASKNSSLCYKLP
jgi:hypothetical protein